MSDDRRTGGGEVPFGGHPSLTGVLVTLGGIAALAILALAIEPLRSGISDAVRGDTAALRTGLRELDLAGVLIVLGLAVAHAFVWYPTEILDAAAGFVYGFWGALALMMAGWIVNGLIAWWIGGHAARPLLLRFAGEERFLRLERLVGAGGVTLLLAMRLVPIVPFSLFSYVAGAARVPLPRFIWTTAVGYLPLTVLFVYLGSRLEELSPTDPLLWAGAVVLIALLLLTRRLARVISDADRSERAGSTR